MDVLCWSWASQRCHSLLENWRFREFSSRPPGGVGISISMAFSWRSCVSSGGFSNYRLLEKVPGLPNHFGTCRQISAVIFYSLGVIADFKFSLIASWNISNISTKKRWVGFFLSPRASCRQSSAFLTRPALGGVEGRRFQSAVRRLQFEGCRSQVAGRKLQAAGCSATVESCRVFFLILANPFCTSWKRRVWISPFYGKSTYLHVERFLCRFVAVGFRDDVDILSGVVSVACAP